MALANSLDKIWRYAFLGFAIFPLYHLNFSSYYLLVWGVVALGLCILDFRTFTKNLQKGLPFIILFLLYIVAIPFTDNKDMGYYFLGQKFSFLAFPLIFAAGYRSISRELIELGQRVFSIGIIVFALGIYATLIIKGIAPDQVHTSVYLLRVNFDEVSGIHPGYFSMFLYTAALFSFTLSWDRLKYGKILRVLLPILAIGLALPLAARAPLLAFIVVALYLLIVKFWSVKWFKIGFPVVLLSVILLALLLPGNLNRFSDLNSHNFKPPVGDNHNGTNTRIGVWLCDLTLLGDNWMTGVSPGDLQDNLNSCYKRYDTDFYEGRNFNTHSEYLNIWLSFGVLGFLYFIGFLIYMWRYTQKKQALGLQEVLMLLFISLLTENYLDRQMGIFFFSFIGSMAIYLPSREQIGLEQLGKKHRTK